MPSLPDDTRILTKHICPDCYKGKVPHDDDTKLYDYTYCPTCDGTGYVQYWASIIELARALNKANSILATGK